MSEQIVYEGLTQHDLADVSSVNISGTDAAFVQVYAPPFDPEAGYTAEAQPTTNGAYPPQSQRLQQPPPPRRREVYEQPRVPPPPAFDNAEALIQGAGEAASVQPPPWIPPQPPDGYMPTGTPTGLRKPPRFDPPRPTAAPQFLGDDASGAPAPRPRYLPWIVGGVFFGGAVFVAGRWWINRKKGG